MTIKGLLPFAALALLAACISIQSPLPNAAIRLDRAAGDLYKDLRALERPLSVLPEARQLAESADRFAAAVEDSHSRERLREHFVSVNAAYANVRGEIGRTAIDAAGLAQLDLVSHALAAIEHELGASSAPLAP